MSNKNKDTEKLVNNYLKEIKKNLPDWIKEDPKMLDDIELEISAHIWDSASEIAGMDEPSVINVQKAINNMGPAKDIARSYKQRGTPKIFISEELWPNYKKTLFFLTSIIIIFLAIVQLAIFEPSKPDQAFLNTFNLALNTIPIFVIIITAIFGYISAEGFLPEDFSKSKKKEEKASKFYKPGEFLFSGLFNILFGLIVIILPKDIIGLFRVIVNWIISVLQIGTPDYTDFVLNSDLQLWVMMNGFLTVLVGLISLFRLKTKDPNYQSNMNFFFIIIKLIDLTLIIYIYLNINLLVDVFPMLSETVVVILIGLGFLGTIVDIGSTISRSIKLNSLKE